MTIEIPTPSADLLSQIETASIEIQESETAAVAAIRERFAPYAKHNGYIKTGDESQSTSNSSWSRQAYYSEPGPTLRTRGLLCHDSFDDNTNRGDQNRGTYSGSRLYLTDANKWLEITRSGSWSRWQGEGEGWACGDVDWDDATDETDDSYGDVNSGYSGGTKTLTDAEVAARYNVDEILAELGKSMTVMCQKLPERFNRIKARAELSARIIDGLKA
jgi:hypothetical protein